MRRPPARRTSWSEVTPASAPARRSPVAARSPRPRVRLTDAVEIPVHVGKRRPPPVKRRPPPPSSVHYAHPPCPWGSTGSSSPRPSRLEPTRLGHAEGRQQAIRGIAATLRRRADELRAAAYPETVVGRRGQPGAEWPHNGLPACLHLPQPGLEDHGWSVSRASMARPGDFASTAAPTSRNIKPQIVGLFVRRRIIRRP